MSYYIKVYSNIHELEGILHELLLNSYGEKIAEFYNGNIIKLYEKPQKDNDNTLILDI